jgi:hypothetical protein
VIDCVLLSDKGGDLWGALGKLSQLKRLTLERLPELSFKSSFQFPGALKRLRVRGCPLVDSAPAFFEAFPAQLEIFDGDVAMVDYFPAENLKQLKELRAIECRGVAEMPQLTLLDLGGGCFDEQLVALCRGAPQLESLYLNNCRDLSEPGLIEALSMLKNLSSLQCQGTQFSADAILEALVAADTTLNSFKATGTRSIKSCMVCSRLEDMTELACMASPQVLMR